MPTSIQQTARGVISPKARCYNAFQIRLGAFNAQVVIQEHLDQQRGRGVMTDNKKQWYLLILATAWLFIALALTVCALYITRDLRSALLAGLTTPPIALLHRLYHYHFPPSAADYEIQKLKIQNWSTWVQRKNQRNGDHSDKQHKSSRLF